MQYNYVLKAQTKEISYTICYYVPQNKRDFKLWKPHLRDLWYFETLTKKIFTRAHSCQEQKRGTILQFEKEWERR